MLLLLLVAQQPRIRPKEFDLAMNGRLPLRVLDAHVEMERPHIAVGSLNQHEGLHDFGKGAADLDRSVKADGAGSSPGHRRPRGR